MNIKEIAKLANVSVATVSRVINESPKVKSSTRELILLLMKEHGYVPNTVARSLSKRRSNNIAVVVPDIGNEFFAELISGMSEVFDQHNYNMLFFNTDENAENEHAALNIISGGLMSGIIITPVSSTDSWTAEKLHEFREKKNVPVVLVDRQLRNEPFDTVNVDNERGAFEATEALINAGHTKIGIITGPETSLPGQGRKDGYLQALHQYGIPIRQEYIVSGEFRLERSYVAMGELMHLPDPPTAVFTSNNESTLGLMRYLSEKNLEIGRDISVIGFDAINALKVINYPFSAVERDVALQGKMAASRLMQRLVAKEGATVECVSLLVGHQLVLRGSERLRKK
ncbi:MAG: LacI family DNA-binding transcriptional regulator [Peptoniphilaceae bacterium]|nr:LacI family DNA-binding transcriptional regulator [Peptoniphilaceae bacterium]